MQRQTGEQTSFVVHRWRSHHNRLHRIRHNIPLLRSPCLQKNFCIFSEKISDEGSRLEVFIFSLASRVPTQNLLKYELLLFEEKTQIKYKNDRQTNSYSPVSNPLIFPMARSVSGPSCDWKAKFQSKTTVEIVFALTKKRQQKIACFQQRGLLILFDLQNRHGTSFQTLHAGYESLTSYTGMNRLNRRA